ncbi:MAG TPA: 3-dehydroquinate synthase, partial [Lentisphaeria bacterium]|nr:3-dehydroquinate synthase [Lentisphaeria bacterium]
LGREHDDCSGLSAEAVLAAMRLDKKNRDGRLRLVLPTGIGRASIAKNVADDDVLAALREVLHD